MDKKDHMKDHKPSGDFSPADENYMREALVEAGKAAAEGEIPIGCVIVRHGEIIARGHNLREQLQDPTAHAEVLAIKEAANRLGSWRLLESTLYVTIEPCPMCAGAIINARIPRLVFGALDPKAGAAGSLYNLVEDERFNHRVDVTGGVLADECAGVVREFFVRLRNQG